MRNSGEAQCPSPKRVQDPTDHKYSIQEVFFNICGLVEGSTTEVAYVSDYWLQWNEKYNNYEKQFSGEVLPCCWKLGTVGQWSYS